jgi:translation initiation factor IF-3
MCQLPWQFINNDQGIFEVLTLSGLSLWKVRLVGEGINEITTIQDAVRQAEDMGLDLILVSDEATPPVVRIEDFKKLEYEKKKARKANKQAVSTLKEVQFKVNISEHDLATKLDKINKFLERGDKVKVSVKLKGRERETPRRQPDLLRKVCSSVECKVNFVPGPIAISILEPVKKASTKKASPTKKEETPKFTTS